MIRCLVLLSSALLPAVFSCSTSTQGCCPDISLLQQTLQVQQVLATPPIKSSPELSSISQSVVVLTYCDAAFAPIWPTFIQCFANAVGCALEGTGVRCLPHKPQLLDLGLDPSATGHAPTHCTRTKVPETKKGLVFSQLTPPTVPLLLMEGMFQQLSEGKDVLRLDADAFLFADPLKFLSGTFQHADIISSFDCVADPSEYCNWYVDGPFQRRHNGTDPLARTGFMLNTGLIYLRSNPKTIELARVTSEAVQSGISTFEQTALNEALVDLRCRWSVPEQGNRPAPGGQGSKVVLGTTTILGSCDGGLSVIVLPYVKATRSMELAAGAFSMHPGRSMTDKIAMLPNISALCDRSPTQY